MQGIAKACCPGGETFDRLEQDERGELYPGQAGHQMPKPLLTQVAITCLRRGP
jgi:hypothetical protein